jgi:hypothetical protein
MMRGLSVVVLIAGLSVGVSCQQKPLIDHKPPENPGKQTTVSNESGNNQSVCCCKATPIPESNRTVWYAALEQPDWWVVIIAALTGLAVAWQSFETRRAAQAMKASNQANIRSQRARLSVQQEHRDTTRGSHTDRVFQLIARNFGQTIAEIYEIDTKLEHFGPEIFKHFETMDFPAPTANVIREPQILLPGERWQVAELSMSEVVEPGREFEIEQGRRIPVWYGWLMFRDLAGEVHRRRFFLMFSGRNRTFFEVGPQGWNSED